MTPTTGELNIMVKNIEEKLGEHIISSKESYEKIAKLIEENTIISKTTLEQATKTNGRVNNLDSWRKDSAEPMIKEYNRYKWMIIGGGILVSLCGFYFWSLYVDKLKGEITNEATAQLINTLEKQYYIKIQ